MLTYLSNWPVIPTLGAIALFGTVTSLLLQRIFGGQIALVAIGPVICVLGVFVFMAARSRNQTEK